jgi:hypothetical protein
MSKRLYDAVLASDADEVRRALAQGDRLNTRQLGTLEGAVHLGMARQEYFSLCHDAMMFEQKVQGVFSNKVNVVEQLRDLYMTSTLPPEIKAPVMHELKALAFNDALWAAFYSGTGKRADDKLARVRYLTGMGHAGLYPIRKRLVFYLVDEELIRFLRVLRV